MNIMRMPEAPWVGDFYDEYRNRFYGLVDADEEPEEEWEGESDEF